MTCQHRYCWHRTKADLKRCVGCLVYLLEAQPQQYGPLSDDIVRMRAPMRAPISPIYDREDPAPDIVIV